MKLFFGQRPHKNLVRGTPNRYHNDTDPPWVERLRNVRTGDMVMKNILNILNETDRKLVQIIIDFESNPINKVVAECDPIYYLKHVKIIDCLQGELLRIIKTLEEEDVRIRKEIWNEIEDNQGGD